MTEAEIKKAEKEAESDAEWLGLLLLLALSRRDGRAVQRIAFDTIRGRFLIDGKVVSAVSIRAHLARIDERVARRLLRLNIQLELGRITLAEWKAEFERNISSALILKAGLALGGIGVAVRDPRVQSALTSQLGFADEFARAIENDRAGSFARIKARAKNYLQATHILYTRLELELIKSTGAYAEARNRLTPAEHCASGRDRFGAERTGCPELTDLGWMPVAEMVPIGERACTRYCKCFLEYR
jgi:hypothetical protein